MQMTIEERNTFIEKNSGIIGDIAKPYMEIAKQYGYEYGDLFNSGVVGIIEGIETYDIDQATTENGIVPLEAFVRYAVKKHISAFIAKPRKHDRLENKRSMNQKVYSNDLSSVTTIGDKIADEKHEVNFGENIDKERVRNLLNSDILSGAEKIAVNARFITGLKFREIDELVREYLGNPKARGFYFINTALDKLRKALA